MGKPQSIDETNASIEGNDPVETKIHSKETLRRFIIERLPKPNTPLSEAAIITLMSQERCCELKWHLAQQKY